MDLRVLKFAIAFVTLVALVVFSKCALAHTVELVYTYPNGRTIEYSPDAGGVYRNVRYDEDYRIDGSNDVYKPIFASVTLSHPEFPNFLKNDDGTYMRNVDGTIMRHPLYSPIHNHVHQYTTNRGEKWFDYFNVGDTPMIPEPDMPTTPQDNGDMTGADNPMVDDTPNVPMVDSPIVVDNAETPVVTTIPRDDGSTDSIVSDVSMDDEMTEVDVEPMPETDEQIIVVNTVEYVYYSMTFPKGISALHLPIKSKNIWFTGLVEQLGDDNVNWISALRPTVQIWTVVRSVNSVIDEWISDYRGFVAYMENETIIELKAVKRGYGYTMMYVKQGYNLIGVPRMSESLVIVDDFYKIFPCVDTVMGMPMDLIYDMPDSVDLDWFDELDGDTVIDGTTGYLLNSTDDNEYPLWGVQWQMPVSAAPSVSGESRSIFTNLGSGES